MYSYVFFFKFFSIIGYYKLLDIIPCAIQQDLVFYLFYIECLSVNPITLVFNKYFLSVYSWLALRPLVVSKTDIGFSLCQIYNLGMDTEDRYINTMEYYSVMKRKNNAISATHMDLEIIILR